MEIRDFLSRANQRRGQLNKLKLDSDAERSLRSEISELELEIQLKIDEVEDERTREVMSLYYVLGLSDEDIADDLLISSRTVRRILHNGITELSK